MESIDSSMRPSAAMKMFGLKDVKLKRRKVSKIKSENQKDVSKHHQTEYHHSVMNLSREERIQLYMSRAVQTEENRKIGLNPISVLTGELVTDEELKIEGDINEE